MYKADIPKDVAEMFLRDNKDAHKKHKEKLEKLGAPERKKALEMLTLSYTNKKNTLREHLKKLPWEEVKKYKTKDKDAQAFHRTIVQNMRKARLGLIQKYRNHKAGDALPDEDFSPFTQDLQADIKRKAHIVQDGVNAARHLRAKNREQEVHDQLDDAAETAGAAP